MEVKVYKSRPHFQEVWEDRNGEFSGLTRLSRPGRPAAFFTSRAAWPCIGPGVKYGFIELPDNPQGGLTGHASPALAGME